MTHDQVYDLWKLVLDKAVLAIIAGVVLVVANVMAQKTIEGFKREREDARERERRQTIPRTQFDLALEFVGRQNGDWLVAISLRVSNISTFRRKFRRIRIRLRTIETGETLEHWTQSGALHFPHKKAEHDMIEKGNYYYVEPGITQTFTFVTKIPETSTFVLANALCKGINAEGETEYDNEFSEERVFQVPSVER